jgi:hypothetical protein
MSMRINGQVRKTLLESGEESGHIRCPKPDTSVLTGQMIMKELRGILGAEIKRGMLIEST